MAKKKLVSFRPYFLKAAVQSNHDFDLFFYEGGHNNTDFDIYFGQWLISKIIGAGTHQFKSCTDRCV